MSELSTSPGNTAVARWTAGGGLVSGGWALLPPYTGPALDTSARVEFADHVVPGVAVIAISASALLLANRWSHLARGGAVGQHHPGPALDRTPPRRGGRASQGPRSRLPGLRPHERGHLRRHRGHLALEVYTYDREPPDTTTALAAPGPDPSYPSEHAAIAGAASRLLAYLNPELPAARFDQLAQEAAMSRVWAGAASPSDVDAGLALGRAVAEEVIAHEADGSHATWDGSRPPGIGDGPEFWEPAPGSAAPPTQPLAGTWTAWVLDSGDQLRAEAPPPFGSEEFRAQVQAVLDARAKLTSEQHAIADFWAGGVDTPLPPGIWNQVALDYVRRDQLSTPRSARVFALLNVALSDAGAACWDTKFAYWFPRPVTAIRDLGLDPDWEPYLQTPSFPSYASGHSTYSGAAAEVLGHLFPDDADELRARADEAAISRLYGGIHFPIDNQRGLEMGPNSGSWWSSGPGATGGERPHRGPERTAAPTSGPATRGGAMTAASSGS